MQRSVVIAIDGVIDSHRAGRLKQRVTQGRHVEQVTGTILTVQTVEAGDDRVGKKKCIAGKVLSIA